MRSGKWAIHPLNRRVPATNWRKLDADLAGLSEDLGFEFDSFVIDSDAYGKFKSEFPAGRLYARRYRDKKMLEHFIALQLLRLRPGDIYLDVASENSPYPELFRSKLAVNAYSQDLSYPHGTHGYRIGSSADAIPLPSGTVDGMSLQCAFEHFANDVDSGFIRETARLLKPGGGCIIVPLYMGDTYLNIVNPVLDYSWVRFDAGALPVGETNLGGTFERVYSPSSLERIIIPDIGLRYMLHRVHIPGEVLEAADKPEAVSRIRYVLEIRKKGADTKPRERSGHSRA